MNNYTARQQVADIVAPVWGFLEDISPCVPSTYYRYADANTIGLSIVNHDVIFNEKALLNSSKISAHTAIEFKSIIDSKKTDILIGISRAIDHIPLLTGENRKIELRLHLTNQHRPEPELIIDDIPILRVKKEQDLVKDLYIFIRTHENLDLSGKMSPYSLNGKWGSMSYMGNIYADSPANALLRFAACKPNIRSDIRGGDHFYCTSADHPTKEELIEAFSSRLYKQPALQLQA